MRLWKNSKMKTFFGDETPLEDWDCTVRLGDGHILVSYEWEEGGMKTYEGTEIGQGHFALKATDGDGQASLHCFANGKILDGWWAESGSEGMWRVTLGD